MTGTIQILYVDDEQQLLDVGKLFLQKDREFDVTTLTSAQEALLFLDHHSVDAIISDYQMPGMDGIAFLKALREQGDHTPFIIFSGKGREEVVIEALNIGAEFYLQKGGEPRSQFAELAHKIRHAVARRRVEAALRESERKYRDLYHFAGVALFEVNHSDATLVACNQLFCDLFGFPTVEEAIGQSIEPFYTDPQDRDTMIRLFRVQGFLKDHVTRFRNPRTGKEFFAQLSARYDPDRDISIGSILDITDQKQAEEDLRESEERYRALVDHALDPILILDFSGQILFANHAAAALVDLDTPEVAIGRCALEFIAPESREKVIRDLACVEKGTDAYIAEYRVISVTGKQSRVEAIGKRIIYQGKPADLAMLRDISERKLAEEQIREREEMYRTLFEHASDLILVYEITPEHHPGKILDANRLACLSLGYTKDELRGLSLSEISGPISPEERMSISREMAVNQYARFEGTVSPRDGTIVPVEVSTYLLKAAEGFRSVSIIRDISERKTWEQALRQSEEQYRTLTGNLPGIVYRVSLKENSRMQFFNDQLPVLTGYAEPELIHGDVCSIDPLIHPDDREGVVAAVESAIAERTAFAVNYRLIHKDGSTRHFRERGRIIAGSDGEPGYIDGVIDDITEQKQYEAALRRSEERYRSLAEASPDLIFIVDRHDIVQYVNSFAAQQLQKPAATIVGNPRKDLFPAPVAERQAQFLETVFSTGIPFRGESRVPFGDREVWIDTCIVPLKGENGDIPAVIGISRDITERKRYEEALRETNRKQSLLSSITRHDILNQLTILHSYLDLSRDQQDDPGTFHEYIRRAEKAASTIEEQIRFTKDYQDLGMASPVWHEVYSSIQQAHHRLPMQSVTLDVDCTGLEILADPLFEKVFYNLIDNAMKYGGDRMTTIRVSSHETGEGLTLVCEDDGVGISAGDKERLFTKGFGNNTGLGLFLAREILSITGITITESGAPGEGARFEMHVPMGGYRFVSEN